MMLSSAGGMYQCHLLSLCLIHAFSFLRHFATYYCARQRPINEKDRHVLAAAVASSAQVIVTQNLKDFPQGYLSSFGVEAQAPDEFLMHLFYLAPKQVINIIAMQAQDLQKPPKTVIELLDTLKQHAPNFVNLIRNYLFKSTSS
jgi:hypothetical protein